MRSMTLQSSAFSRLRCCVGVSSRRTTPDPLHETDLPEAPPVCRSRSAWRHWGRGRACRIASATLAPGADRERPQLVDGFLRGECSGRLAPAVFLRRRLQIQPDQNRAFNAGGTGKGQSGIHPCDVFVYRRRLAPPDCRPRTRRSPPPAEPAEVWKGRDTTTVEIACLKISCS